MSSSSFSATSLSSNNRNGNGNGNRNAAMIMVRLVQALNGGALLIAQGQGKQGLERIQNILARVGAMCMSCEDEDAEEQEHNCNDSELDVIPLLTPRTTSSLCQHRNSNNRNSSDALQEDACLVPFAIDPNTVTNAASSFSSASSPSSSFLSVLTATACFNMAVACHEQAASSSSSSSASSNTAVIKDDNDDASSSSSLLLACSLYRHALSLLDQHSHVLDCDTNLIYVYMAASWNLTQLETNNHNHRHGHVDILQAMVHAFCVAAEAHDCPVYRYFERVVAKVVTVTTENHNHHNHDDNEYDNNGDNVNMMIEQPYVPMRRGADEDDLGFEL